MTTVRLKGGTAYAVPRECTSTRVRARTHRHLWSPSYSAVSYGSAPLTIIKHYIEGQTRPLEAPGHARR